MMRQNPLALLKKIYIYARTEPNPQRKKRPHLNIRTLELITLVKAVIQRITPVLPRDAGAIVASKVDLTLAFVDVGGAVLESDVVDSDVRLGEVEIGKIFVRILSLNYTVFTFDIQGSYERK